ncbi:MAG: arginine--tRNA ligase [Patescibacteria group bacterium]|nr:arginine--tRNA ligase [Patescibacteria group bacterium]
MVNKEIKEILDKIVGDLYKDIKIPDFVVEWPKQKEHGDYSSNIAMVLAGKLNKNPMEISEEIKNKINIMVGPSNHNILRQAQGDKQQAQDDINKNLFVKITVAKPGFINFRISDQYLRKNLCAILKKKNEFGSSDLGKNKTIVIDYSAPNIAKPMHVGHLRSTIIGQSLYNIYKYLGYKVIGDNHTGDWGTQFGKLIYAYKYWGDKKKIKKNPIEEMTKLYVRFHKEVETNKELEELARKETKKLQDKNNENIKIWKFLVKESLKDYKKIYEILGIKFDYVLGESFYDDMLVNVIKECAEKKISSKSEGAIIVNLDKFNLPPFLIRKTDGAYLYATTDLATIKYREDKFRADKILYVVSNEQALYFQQLFSSSELLGWNDKVKLEHIKFGMVLGEMGKKLSTRRGETIKLEDVIKKSIELAKKVVEEKNPKLSNKEKKGVARTVGLGSIKYNDLSQNRLTDITFDWDKMLSFEGNSAPYLQYAYARINSLMKKYNALYKLDRINILDKPDFNLLKENIEKNIMRHLLKFPEVIENSARENSPHLIALYIYELASLYNNFYNSTPILKSERNIAKARIALSKSVATTIKNGLNLLGIDVLEKM